MRLLAGWMPVSCLSYLSGHHAEGLDRRSQVVSPPDSSGTRYQAVRQAVPSRDLTWPRRSAHRSARTKTGKAKQVVDGFPEATVCITPLSDVLTMIASWADLWEAIERLEI